MQRAWVEEIQFACQTAGTAFFFKQWGGVRKDRTGRSFKGATFDEMPAARLP
jgi:protein gp37